MVPEKAANRFLQESRTFFNSTQKFCKSDIYQWYPKKNSCQPITAVKSDIFQWYWNGVV